MEIRYKLYPYPVLSYYSDDYGGSSFEVNIDAKRDGYNLRIDFSASLKNEELQHYLFTEDVKFATDFPGAVRTGGHRHHGGADRQLHVHRLGLSPA